MKALKTILISAVWSTLALTMPQKSFAADLILPQNRSAFYSSEPIELAYSGVAKGEAVSVEFVPDKKELASWKFSATDSTAVQVVPPFALAPAVYTVMLNGKESGKITISGGVNNSTMLVSQSSMPAPQGGANFNLGNAFSFGLIGRDGMPLREVRGLRSQGLNPYENAVAKDIPTVCYMYWTGYVTHKPWGSEKSWANAAMTRDMRLFNLHTAQYLRRYDRNILSVGTLDEPGLSWGKTPAGGMASGFPNWDEAPWYEARGWKYSQDIAAGSDADWMKYMTIRAGIMKEQNAQAKADLKSVWPSMKFSTDIYAPSAIMDGTDPMNQQVNDIPSSHIFMDWGTGKAGVIGALYLEKAHDPTSKIAHAMNGQLFSTLVPQPQQTYSYHLMMNGMLAAGLHSNWWLNTGNMSAENLKAVSDPALRIGPLFQEMTPHADIAVLWSFTEAAMRQKDMAARESKKKDGAQIKMMISSWPETNEAAGTGEQSVNAYSIGGNYKEQILNAHQAINRAGYAAHILHEKILPRGVLRNYKVLVVVGQTFALPADIQKQIADFQKRGGKVIVDSTTTQAFPGALKTEANLRDPAFRWSGVFSLNPATNSKVTTKQASYYQTNFWMDKQAREATPLMKSTLAKTAAAPVFDNADAWLAGERHVAGEGQMMMVLNAFEKLPDIKDTESYWIYNYAPLQAKYSLQGVPKNAAVYEISGLDWKASRGVSTPAAPMTTSFEPGEMKLYLVAPRAPSGLNLSAQSKSGVLAVTAGLKNLKMPWPLTVTIKDASGATLYSVYRATNASGQYAESFPIGVNGASKQYSVSVQSPVANLSAQTTAVSKASTLAATSLRDAVRVFDASAITKLLASKPEIVVAYGETQKLFADRIVTGLASKGVRAKALPEAQVMRKALYPRVWNPFAKYYAATGDVKMPEGAEIKIRITIDAKKDGSFSAKDETGKEWSDDWKQPNSLVTVGGDGFVDYLNQDSETVFEPGVQLYFNKDRAMTVVKGTPRDEKTTEEFKAKWSRPWNRLGTYVGGVQIPPQLPEAYEVSTHLIVLGDSTQSELVAALQASELLPQIADAKYPGAGKALLEYAWSPFGLNKDIIFIGASDAAGVDAGVNKLIELLRRQ